MPIRAADVRKCPHSVQTRERTCFLFFPSGVSFQGTTIGMAPIMSMCTAEQSGGVVMVRLEAGLRLLPPPTAFQSLSKPHREKRHPLAV